MEADPSLAAKDAASVTQNVTAITLTNSRDPEWKNTKQSNTIG